MTTVDASTGTFEQTPAYRTPDELEAFHAVKRAFDPEGLLNPGKAVPTLARCADYGAMRVHGGKLPFSHLPRF